MATILTFITGLQLSGFIADVPTCTDRAVNNFQLSNFTRMTTRKSHTQSKKGENHRIYEN